MVEFLVDEVGYAFPAVTAHALRRATKRWHHRVPRPTLDFKNVPGLGFLVERHDSGEKPDDAAVVEFMKEACERQEPLRKYCFRVAARVGNLSVLQWLHDTGFPHVFDG
jgi:hypothetical protein